MRNGLGSLRHLSALSMVSVCLTGCSSYVTPGRGAEFSELGLTDPRRMLTDGIIREALDRQALAAFPTRLAVIRIQSPGYHSRTTQGWGTGRYSIVTTRDIETEAHFDRLAKMPQVKGVAPVNRLLFESDRLDSDLPLCHAAGLLHADMLLIYTLDTTFRVDDAAVPLTVISLGLSPNRAARATTTASAVLMGTHNGYIYGIAEATARNDRLASAWTDSQAIDDARRRTEAQAFENLLGELEKTWTQVIQQYADR